MSRGWLVASLLIGCGFKPGASTDGGPPTQDDAPEQFFDAAGSGSGSGSGSAFLPACTTDGAYTTRPGTAHRYRVLTGSMVFDDAVDACSQDGGAHLATITDTGESDYIHAQYHADFYWFGLTDTVTEGSPHWFDGETYAFTNWGGGEPSDGGGSHNEDCGIFSFNDGKWNDVRCDEMHRPLCECEPDYHAPPVPTCRSATTAKLANGRKYIVLDTATWADANTSCTAMGGYLMVPSDNNENDRIQDGNAINAGGDVWIGLIQDPNDAAKWAWSNNSLYGFESWSGTKPNPAPGSCGKAKPGNGDWESADCATQLHAVCECDPGVD